MYMYIVPASFSVVAHIKYPSYPTQNKYKDTKKRNKRNYGKENFRFVEAIVNLRKINHSPNGLVLLRLAGKFRLVRVIFLTMGLFNSRYQIVEK